MRDGGRAASVRAMSSDQWLLFIAGGLVSFVGAAVFLYTLHLGLRQRRWWPLIVVSMVWLAMMVAYAAWDSGNRRDEGRRRAVEFEAGQASVHPTNPKPFDQNGALPGTRG